MDSAIGNLVSCNPHLHAISSELFGTSLCSMSIYLYRTSIAQPNSEYNKTINSKNRPMDLAVEGLPPAQHDEDASLRKAVRNAKR